MNFADIPQVSAMDGLLCCARSCSMQLERKHCKSISLTPPHAVKLTYPFLATSSAQPTSSPSPWCGLFIQRPTREHSRYKHPYSRRHFSRIDTDTPQEIDLLFEADSPWVWDAEKHFAKLLEENPNRVLAASRSNSVVDPEAGVKKADHADTASEVRQEVAHGSKE